MMDLDGNIIQYEVSNNECIEGIWNCIDLNSPSSLASVLACVSVIVDVAQPLQTSEG